MPIGSTRRAILAGATALASLFVARRSVGQAVSPTAVPPAPPTPGTTPTPAPPAAPGPLARAAAERFGQFLTAEERKMLDEEMASIERRGARLREIKLQNAEEPSTDFYVSRA